MAGNLRYKAKMLWQMVKYFWYITNSLQCMINQRR